MEAAASAGQLKEVIPPLHRKSRCAEKKWSLSAGHAEGRKNGSAGCGSVIDMVVQTKSFKYLNQDRKSTRLNSSHVAISYAVFCLKKKKKATEMCRPTSSASRDI